MLWGKGLLGLRIKGQRSGYFQNNGSVNLLLNNQTNKNMAAYPDYDEVFVWRDKNNKLKFQADSMWYPSTAEQKTKEVLEERIESSSIADSFMGVSFVNGFSIPSNLTDFFIENCLPLLPHKKLVKDGEEYWKLSIKTDSNERNELGILPCDGFGLDQIKIYSESELENEIKDILGEAPHFVFALHKHIEDSLFKVPNLKWEHSIRKGLVKFVIVNYSGPFNYKYESQIFKNPTWKDLLISAQESGIKKIRSLGNFRSMEGISYIKMEQEDRWRDN